jgi:hypothetical protein
MKSAKSKILVTALVVVCLNPLAVLNVGAATVLSVLAIGQVNTNYRTDNVKASDEFKVYLNSEDKTSTFGNPINVTTEGRTLLPLRDLGNLLGCTIDWNSEHKVAIVTKDSTTIEVPIGSTNIIINGTSQKIDDQGTQAIIVDSRTYLPFRSIAEAAGATVDYKVENGYKNIYITTDNTITPAPSTDTDLKTFKDLGYTATNGPSEGQPYYSSWKRAVEGFRSVGLSDDQINQNLQYIVPCAANDSGSGVTSIEQADHYSNVTDKAWYAKPDYKGTYKYQMYGYWMWNGTSWTTASMTYCGLSGLSLGSSNY